MIRKKVMVLDDHPIIRRSVESVLRQDQLLEIVGSFGRSDELVAALQKEVPDVLVLDFQLGQQDVDGLNLLLRLTRRYPEMKVVVLSGIERASNIQALAKSGAMGFVGKSQDLDALLTAVRAVIGGRTSFPKGIESSDQPNKPLGKQLTIREMEVVRCCLQGMTTKAIAEKFHRSETTISTHKSSAFRKLGIESSSDLHRAHADGLLDGFT